MEPVKSYHMCLDIDADYRKWGRFVTEDGKPVTAYRFEEVRAEYKAKGYEAFPPCDSVTDKGRCAGHPLDENERDRLEALAGRK